MRAAALVPVLLSAACLDAPPSGIGAPPGDDAGEGLEDAGRGADAAGGGIDAGVNLIVNGDFEAGVAGWVDLRADIGEETATVHAGAASAWACLDAGFGAGDVYGLDTAEAVVPAPAGGAYRVEAWVRAGVGASAQPMSLSLRMSPGDIETSPGVAAAEDWVHLTFEAEVGGSGSLTVRVRAVAASAGDCMLVDDVVLTRL